MINPTIRVVCGVIVHEGKVLTTQRAAAMKEPLKWEFPGGKLEDGESQEDCLHRELMEELGIKVRITSRMPVSEYQYQSYLLQLIPFSAEFVSGEIRLHEHAAYKWCSFEELKDLDWAPADVTIVQTLIMKQN